MDPIYIRYIYDSLLSGKLSIENASTLPLGLTGLYQKQFGGELNISDRNNKVELLLFWAVVKSPLSIEDMALIFSVKREDVVQCVSDYSKWFNVKNNDQYVLYHDRLRTFLLQISSDYEILKTHKIAADFFCKYKKDDLLSLGLIQYKYHYCHQHLGNLVGSEDANALDQLEKLAFSDEFLLQQKTQTGSRGATDELFKLLFRLHQGNVAVIERIFVRYLQVITGLPSSGMSLEELCKSDVKTFQREMERAFIQQQYASITFVLIVQLFALKNEAEKVSSFERLTCIDQLLLQHENAVQPLTTLLTAGLDAKSVDLIQIHFQSIDEFLQLKKLLQIASFDKQKYFDDKDSKVIASKFWQWLTTHSFWVFPLLVLLIPVSFLLNLFTALLVLVLFTYLKSRKDNKNTEAVETFRKALKKPIGFILLHLGYFYTYNVIKAFQLVLSFYSQRLARKNKRSALILVALFQGYRHDNRCASQIRLADLSSSKKATVKWLRRSARSYQRFGKSLDRRYRRSEGIIRSYNIVDTFFLDKWPMVGWMKSNALRQCKETYREFGRELKSLSIEPVKATDKLEVLRASLHYMLKHESDVGFVIDMLNEVNESSVKIAPIDVLEVLCEFSYQNSAPWLLQEGKKVWSDMDDPRLLKLACQSENDFAMMTFRDDRLNLKYELSALSYICEHLTSENYPISDFLLFQWVLKNIELNELLEGDWGSEYPELSEFYEFVISLESEETSIKPETAPTILDDLKQFFIYSKGWSPSYDLPQKLGALKSEPDKLMDSEKYRMEMIKFGQNKYEWHFFMDYSTVDLFEQLTEFGDSERKVMAVHMARNLYRCGSFDDFWHRLIVFQVGDDDEILRAGMRYYYDRLSKREEDSGNAQKIKELLHL